MLEPTSRPTAPLLEVAHVAHRLSASQEYVRRLIRGHKLPAIRLGRRWRIKPLDLDAFLESQRVAGEEIPGSRLHAVTKGA